MRSMPKQISQPLLCFALLAFNIFALSIQQENELAGTSSSSALWIHRNTDNKHQTQQLEKPADSIQNPHLILNPDETGGGRKRRAEDDRKETGGLVPHPYITYEPLCGPDLFNTILAVCRGCFADPPPPAMYNPHRHCCLEPANCNEELILMQCCDKKKTDQDYARRIAAIERMRAAAKEANTDTGTTKEENRDQTTTTSIPPITVSLWQRSRNRAPRPEGQGTGHDQQLRPINRTDDLQTRPINRGPATTNASGIEVNIYDLPPGATQESGCVNDTQCILPCAHLGTRMCMYMDARCAATRDACECHVTYRRIRQCADAPPGDGAWCRVGCRNFAAADRGLSRQNATRLVHGTDYEAGCEGCKCQCDPRPQGPGS